MLEWDINKSLRRFVDDPDSLRTLMAEQGALISGDVALDFFEKRGSHGSDLDIYVRTMHNRVELFDFLRDKEGYAFTKIERKESRSGEVSMRSSMKGFKYPFIDSYIPRSSLIQQYISAHKEG